MRVHNIRILIVGCFKYVKQSKVTIWRSYIHSVWETGPTVDEEAAGRCWSSLRSPTVRANLLDTKRLNRNPEPTHSLQSANTAFKPKHWGLGLEKLCICLKRNHSNRAFHGTNSPPRLTTGSLGYMLGLLTWLFTRVLQEIIIAAPF